MAADSAVEGRAPRLHRGRAIDVVLVLSLGRSSGSAEVAAGLALARGRALQAAGSGWALLAELDPRGGDLLDKLVLGGAPRLNTDREPRAGARELVEHLVSADLGVGTADRSAPTLPPYLVGVAGERGLRVLLGDPLVDGAARAAAMLTPSRLGALAGQAGAAATIIDGGPWTSAEASRLVGVDLVYAVVQARSAAENSRGVAEVAALWRHLRAAERPARLVVVVTDPAWRADEVRRLYEHHTAEGTAERTGYRVVVLGRRQDRRLLARIGSGSWRAISNRALAPLVTLASPIGVRPLVRSGCPPMSELPASSGAAVDEHAYLMASSASASADAPADLGGGFPDSSADGPAQQSAEPDPSIWPFGDGAGLGDWFDAASGEGPTFAGPGHSIDGVDEAAATDDDLPPVQPSPDRPGPPGVEIDSAPLWCTPDGADHRSGREQRSPAVMAAMRARRPELESNGAAPAGSADARNDRTGEVG